MRTLSPATLTEGVCSSQCCRGTADLAEALVDRLLNPHPSEEVVGYVPLRATDAGEAAR